MESDGMQLFAASRKRPRSEMSGETKAGAGAPAEHKPFKGSGDASTAAPISKHTEREHLDGFNGGFAALGVGSWLCRVLGAVGITKPTAIQRETLPHLIKPVTKGGSWDPTRDFIGCAQTGEGKTAAFALPILQQLAEDPYGPFALVLSPSRELAGQIRDSFDAFGAAAHVRVSCITGGCDIVSQGGELSKAPHIIVATPGRLAHHLSIGATKFDLSKLAYLVLDEADRLLEPSFAPDLLKILTAAKGSIGRRRTLLFSATMPADVIGDVTKGAASGVDTDVRSLLALRNPICVDVTPKDATAAITVATLKQQYVFMPAAVKNAYLWHVLEMFIAPSLLPAASRPKVKKTNKGGKKGSKAVTGTDALKDSHRKKKAARGDEDSDAESEEEVEAEEEERAFTHARSIIVFTSTCRGCQMVTEMLIELGIPCTALHSVMPQGKRTSSLAKFKSSVVPVLVATDVASRGLDIPTVDLVLNYDLPQVPSDYIHRVGRTARAGRGGRAISFVTQYDVDLITTIEERVLHGKKMKLLPSIVEDEVLLRLTKVAGAYHLAKNRLEERGFEDSMETHNARKHEAAARSRAYLQNLEGESKV